MSKKPKLEEYISESSGSSSDESSRVESDLEIQVNFDARAILDKDYHGIRRLLRQLFLKAPIDLSEMTECIIQQSHIGSVIKIFDDNNDDKNEGTEEDEEVLGITTALLMKEERKFLSQLTDYLLLKCQEHSELDAHKQLHKILTSTDNVVGVVLHERFLNIPADIGPPLLNCLIEELKKQSKLTPTHYLFITRSHLVPLTKPLTKKRKRPLRQQKHSRSAELVYDFYEMDCLQKECIFKFSYSVSNESDTVQSGRWGFEDESMTPYRSVFILTDEAFSQVITRLVDEFRTS